MGRSSESRCSRTNDSPASPSNFQYPGCNRLGEHSATPHCDVKRPKRYRRKSSSPLRPFMSLLSQRRPIRSEQASEMSGAHVLELVGVDIVFDFLVSNGTYDIQLHPERRLGQQRPGKGSENVDVQQLNRILTAALRASSDRYSIHAARYLLAISPIHVRPTYNCCCCLPVPPDENLRYRHHWRSLQHNHRHTLRAVHCQQTKTHLSRVRATLIQRPTALRVP